MRNWRSALLMGMLTLVSAAVVAVESADVCVVGGGVGGCGTAIAAARAGVSVTLIERGNWLGGTNTQGYVAAWQAGPGDSLAREIYDRLCRMPGGPKAGVARDFNVDRRDGPFALCRIDPLMDYTQTLRRSGLHISQCGAVVFDPEAYDQVLTAMLAETGRCRVLRRTTMVAAQASGKRVTAIEVKPDDGPAFTVHARLFVDSTGGVELCRKLGCETMLGAESRDRFQEPSAPSSPTNELNDISLCYRIRKSDHPRRQPEPEQTVSRWPHSAHVMEIPGGDLMVNPLAIVPGTMIEEKGYAETLALAQRTAQAHWHWLQGIPPFTGYELHRQATMLGIRESYRVVGEYVLTENDLRHGLDQQPHTDIVAVADHRMDLHCHKTGSRLAVVEKPYGIPYRCLIPRGWENLLAACRGASFSHIAASSCRLSRTILALGHAAGLAAAQAVHNNRSVGQVDVLAIQRELQMIKPPPAATHNKSR